MDTVGARDAAVLTVLIAAFFFWTRTDAASLQLTNSQPENNATDVLRTTQPVLTFSTDLNPSRVENHATLQSETTSVPITVTASANSLSIVPASELLPNTSYLLAASGLTGSNGEQLAAPIKINFTTGDGVWQRAQILENDSGYAVEHDIAVNRQGIAVAVWLQFDNSRFAVWASRFTPAGQWQAAQLVSDDRAGSVGSPAVAVASDGSAIVVWDDYNNGVYRLWANRYSPANGWGEPQVIDDTSTRGSRTPEIAIDPTGNALVVWYQYDGQTQRIFATRYTPVGGWETSVAISAISGFPGAFNPKVAFDSRGNAYAMWEQWWQGLTLIWGNRYVAGRGWIAPQIIQTDRTSSGSAPSFAFDGMGNAIAAWEQSGKIYAARYNRDRGWGVAVLFDVAPNEYGPHVAVSQNGDAFITWVQVVITGISNFRGIIWGVRFTDAAGWEAPTLLQSPNGFSANSPQVATDDSGNAIATWYQYNGYFYRIYTKRYRTGSGWTANKVIDTENTVGAYDPRIVIDGGGNALTVWQQSDGSDSGSQSIWSNRFE